MKGEDVGFRIDLIGLSGFSGADPFVGVSSRFGSEKSIGLMMLVIGEKLTRFDCVVDSGRAEEGGGCNGDERPSWLAWSFPGIGLLGEDVISSEGEALGGVGGRATGGKSAIAAMLVG